jgi:hypothetical protein
MGSFERGDLEKSLAFGLLVFLIVVDAARLVFTTAQDWHYG